MVAFAQSNAGAIALVVVFAVGVVLIARLGTARDRRTTFAVPLGMLVGAFVFAVAVGVERGDKVSAYSTSRYMHAGLVFLLPALAVAAGHVARQWRAAYVVVFVLLVAGVPNNVMSVDDDLRPLKLEQALFRRDVLAIPTLGDIDTIDPNTGVLSLKTGLLPVGWLLDSVEAGKVPKPAVKSSETAAFAELRVSLSTILLPMPPNYRCELVRSPTHLALAKSELLRVGGRAQLRPDVEPVPRRFLDVPPTMLIARREPVNVVISAHNPASPPLVCAADRAWQSST